MKIAFKSMAFVASIVFSQAVLANNGISERLMGSYKVNAASVCYFQEAKFLTQSYSYEKALVVPGKDNVTVVTANQALTMPTINLNKKLKTPILDHDTMKVEVKDNSIMSTHSEGGVSSVLSLTPRIYYRNIISLVEDDESKLQLQSETTTRSKSLGGNSCSVELREERSFKSIASELQTINFPVLHTEFKNYLNGKLNPEVSIEEKADIEAALEILK